MIPHLFYIFLDNNSEYWIQNLLYLFRESSFQPYKTFYKYTGFCKRTHANQNTKNFKDQSSTGVDLIEGDLIDTVLKAVLSTNSTQLFWLAEDSDHM